MSPPLAYFLTWTCYGQRLHGDPRGSVDYLNNRRGTPVLTPDPGREERERRRMTGPPFELSEAMRKVADAAIVQLCSDRNWRLIARSVRPTHVHALVNCGGEVSPERAMAALKARLTRELRSEGLIADDARLWTAHGSTRWINHERGLYAAIAYVNEWQTGPNREILEEHKRLLRERMRELRAWLRAQGLPEDGHTVVMGESTAERQRRLAPEAFRNEPGTQ